MSTREKLRQRVLYSTSIQTIRYSELALFLTREGFIRAGGQGSHRVFVRGKIRFTIVQRGDEMVKPYIIREIRDRLL